MGNDNFFSIYVLLNEIKGDIQMRELNDSKECLKEKQLYICPKCNGRGSFTISVEKTPQNGIRYRYPVSEICLFCEGKGCVDWIKNVLRK